jgi:hypothetical protein
MVETLRREAQEEEEDTAPVKETDVRHDALRSVIDLWSLARKAEGVLSPGWNQSARGSTSKPKQNSTADP